MVALVSPRDEIMGRHTTTRMNSTDRYIGKSLWAPDGILRSEGWSRWSKKKKAVKDRRRIRQTISNGETLSRFVRAVPDHLLYPKAPSRPPERFVEASLGAYLHV